MTHTLQNSQQLPGFISTSLSVGPAFPFDRLKRRHCKPIRSRHAERIECSKPAGISRAKSIRVPECPQSVASGAWPGLTGLTTVSTPNLEPILTRFRIKQDNSGEILRSTIALFL